MRAAVVGAGTMGVGIAQAFAAAGYTTEVVDVDEQRAAAGVDAVAAVLRRSVERGQLATAAAAAARARLHARVLHRLEPTVDIVVEAVPEDVELKRSVLREAELARPLLLATNTSSIPIADLAPALRRPDRFVGLHFFNPVWAMPLVEVVVGTGTSAETVELAASTARLLGKEPLVVNDSPGFATSRLGVALGLEAIRMIEDGVATPDVIDRAMELGYGHPMGPLRLTDLVGLDVRLGIARQLQRRLGDRFQPPQLLVDMVTAGHLGKKAKRGFYEW